MSELAFNINGESFEVPANASGWRVRKMRAKGSPEVVYAREGQPLVLPISAEIEDLKNEVDTTGRYRLDLVDQNNKPIEGAPSGYVQINFEAQVAASEAPSAHRNALATQSDNIVLESMRMQSMVAVSVVEKFPAMVEAVATLLRAADGAGLPARPGMALLPTFATQDDDEEDDGDDESTAAPAFDFNALLAQFLPMLLTGLASGKVKMPDLGSVFDWRKAAQKPKAEKVATDTSAKKAQPAETGLPPLDPQTMAHFIAIQSALQPEEAALAREVAGNLSPTELRTWFDEMKKLTVEQAVIKIRTLIAGNAEAVP